MMYTLAEEEYAGVSWDEIHGKWGAMGKTEHGKVKPAR